MAEYNKGTGQTVDQNLLMRMAALEQQVAALKSNKLLTVDRISPGHNSQSVEGQIAVDGDNENFMWFSNHHWRTFGLSWVWELGFAATVAAGDGTSAGAQIKFATGATIHSQGGSNFTHVSETFNVSSGWAGTPYTGDVLLVPVGTYLTVGNMNSFYAVTETFTGPWTFRAFAKSPTVGWNHEDDPYRQTDTWRLKGAAYDPGPYVLDPNIIPESHISGGPLTVSKTETVNGVDCGRVSLQVINFDSQSHFFSDNFFFMLNIGTENTTLS